MAYLTEHRAGDRDAPPQLQTSANDWRLLAAGSRAPAPPARRPGLGYGEAVILPVFQRFKSMGDDSSSLFASLTDPNPFGSYGAESNLTTPAQEAVLTQQAAAAGAYSPYTDPAIVSANAFVPGSVAYNAVQDAGATYKTPGTPAYNALLAAGLSAAQIAKTIAAPGQNVIKAPTVAAAAVPASQIVPGVTNSTVLVIGVIALMFLASGKKR